MFRSARSLHYPSRRYDSPNVIDADTKRINDKRQMTNTKTNRTTITFNKYICLVLCGILPNELFSFCLILTFFLFFGIPFRYVTLAIEAELGKRHSYTHETHHMIDSKKVCEKISLKFKDHSCIQQAFTFVRFSAFSTHSVQESTPNNIPSQNIFDVNRKWVVSKKETSNISWLSITIVLRVRVCLNRWVFCSLWTLFTCFDESYLHWKSKAMNKQKRRFFNRNIQMIKRFITRNYLSRDSKGKTKKRIAKKES